LRGDPEDAVSKDDRPLWCCTEHMDLRHMLRVDEETVVRSLDL
jgi:hypothetical protein